MPAASVPSSSHSARQPVTRLSATQCSTALRAFRTSRSFEPAIEPPPSSLETDSLGSRRRFRGGKPSGASLRRQSCDCARAGLSSAFGAPRRGLARTRHTCAWTRPGLKYLAYALMMETLPPVRIALHRNRPRDRVSNRDRWSDSLPHERRDPRQPYRIRFRRQQLRHR